MFLMQAGNSLTDVLRIVSACVVVVYKMSWAALPLRLSYTISRCKPLIITIALVSLQQGNHSVVKTTNLFVGSDVERFSRNASA